jgi:uncharacterized protein YqgC (DUF456 family)
MATTGLILLVLFLILGFISIFFGLPGTWVILTASSVYGWATGFQRIGIPLLIILAGVAILAEVLEYLMGMAGATRFGASKKGAFVSLLGGIIGALVLAPVLFGLGALIGLFIGAFLGAFFYELFSNRNLKKSIKSGYGAFLGRFSGTMMKILLALGMVVSILWNLF